MVRLTEKEMYGVLYTTNVTWYELFDSFEEAKQFRDDNCAWQFIVKLIVCIES